MQYLSCYRNTPTVQFLQKFLPLNPDRFILLGILIQHILN